MIDPDYPDGDTEETKDPPIALGTGSRQTLRERLFTMLSDGGNLASCFACGICSSGCPASGLDGMDPRKFVRLISLGLDEEIMTSDWVWMCTTCNRCVRVCPMKIDIPQLVLAIRSQWMKEKRPEHMVADLRRSLQQNTCAIETITPEDFKFIVADAADEVRQTQKGFEEITVPMDKKNALFFLNQSSTIAVTEPEQMAPLWKILHLAGADWTYGSNGWAAENFGFFLGDDESWEQVARKKTAALERLGSKIFLNTEVGHDFFAMKQGLEKFNIPHAFKVKSIIEYYADWIRKGALKINSDWNQDRKIKFTLQDPCQLVRKSYGDFIAEELRFVVKAAVGEENFIDMVPNRSNNYCCGGGGGAIFTDFNEERMVYGKIKLAQILETGANYCITPCNNCHSQIRQVGKPYDTPVRALHLWTILCLSMGILGENERKYLGDDLAGVGLT